MLLLLNNSQLNDDFEKLCLAIYTEKSTNEKFASKLKQTKTNMNFICYCNSFNVVCSKIIRVFVFIVHAPPSPSPPPPPPPPPNSIHCQPNFSFHFYI